MPRIAVVYLSYHCEPYIPLVMPAMEKITYPKDRIEWVIVDNPHPEHGSSAHFLYHNVMPRSGVTLPKVTVIENTENLGFAGGNNVGIDYAITHGFDYVFFLNNDAYPSPDAFEQLVSVMRHHPNVGIAQSMLLLHPDKDKINSSGNAIHYLGFGYSNDYKKTFHAADYNHIQDIAYASGAAMMVSASLLKKIGGWNTNLFLYHEDMELSLRAKALAGTRVVLASKSIVHHVYSFRRSISKYYWMERNRFAVWLMYMKWPTLIILAPAMMAMELGQFIFALTRGWWKEKLKVYKYWLQTKHWKLWLVERKKIQRDRMISDRELMKDFVGVILFQENEVESPILKYIANPAFNAYWWVVRKIIVW